MDHHRHLDDELNELRDRVLLLGGEVESALNKAMASLLDRDSELARTVLNHDDDIDRIEVEIDRQCIDIIALRQPAARDLRFVISVAKMAPVLERIATPRGSAQCEPTSQSLNLLRSQSCGSNSTSSG